VARPGREAGIRVEEKMSAEGATLCQFSTNQKRDSCAFGAAPSALD
jgi:hypothetical protein